MDTAEAMRRARVSSRLAPSMASARDLALVDVELEDDPHVGLVAREARRLAMAPAQRMKVPSPIELMVLR